MIAWGKMSGGDNVLDRCCKMGLSRHMYFKVHEKLGGGIMSSIV